MKVDEIQDYISKFGVRVLRENGIEEFFPPQVDAIKNGLFSRENMVIAIPTASGKTLIAELAMVYDVIKGGKCLYTVPLRALAMEKYYEFKKWEKIGIKTGLSIGDYESKDEWLGQKDIIVTTSEKADSLMRNRASWLSKLSCLVVDEIHLLDSAKRGATLEVLIAKLRKTNPGIRIIGLSATIPNADEIAEWLDARVIVSDWRPVPLYEGIFFNGNLEFYTADKAIRTKINGKDHFSLTLDSITRGSQVLIFESTRRNAESTAQKLSSLLFRYFKEKYSNKSNAGAIL
ncbi:MAG TPA: DEAD/DEAH box helicase, partial [Archaeoglobaceae archaeon]|nr:DEAD/DEAH box helicase [Archaeoglobaceae archaeon]